MNKSNIKPPWLKVKACGGKRYLEVQSLLKKHDLHTVCQEANCPNRGECFSSGTATFLILGPNCSRNCTFCNVTFGEIGIVDTKEPQNVARAVGILNLKHAVITSVTRDDLADGGAGQFAQVIEEIKKLGRDIIIEVLIPDFLGRKRDIQIVLEAQPDTFNHNVETVPRLYNRVRPQADYGRSLSVLKMADDHNGCAVKSGLMVGLGESKSELTDVFQDLYASGVDYLTIGQYLSPSKSHYPVQKYYNPMEFDELAEVARDIGIRHVFAAPLVRSSYHAMKQYLHQ